MSVPLVSVVLPTHNRAGSLPSAVGSVLNQTFTNLELIVVDDGSTDATSDVLDTLQDDRLVRLRLEQRRGAAVARNAGIRRALGEWVAFQDSDDEWLPTKLQEQLALLKRFRGLRAVGGRYTIEADTTCEHVAAPHLEAGAEYEPELLDGPCCITPVWLIQRSLLEELGWFDERMPCLEDWDLMLRLTQRVAVRAVPQNVLVKRGAGDSLGADTSRRGPAMEELLRRHGRRFLTDPHRHATFCLEVAYLCLIEGRTRSSFVYALRAFRHRGATPRMLVGFARDCLIARRYGPIWPMPSLGAPR